MSTLPWWLKLIYFAFSFFVIWMYIPFFISPVTEYVLILKITPIFLSLTRFNPFWFPPVSSVSNINAYTSSFILWENKKIFLNPPTSRHVMQILCDRGLHFAYMRVDSLSVCLSVCLSELANQFISLRLAPGNWRDQISLPRLQTALRSGSNVFTWNIMCPRLFVTVANSVCTELIRIIFYY